MENIANKSERVLFFSVAVGLFLLNLWTGYKVELSFDEAYYWMYSQNLAFGYFDHPPMVALMIKAGTTLLGNTEVGVRLFANILTVASYYILWKTLDYKYTKFVIMSILCMPLLTLSGIVALPDTPLLFFSSLFFLNLKKYMIKDSVENVFILALTIACMFYSKYHGLLIVLLSVCANLTFLKRKSFWAVVLLTVIFFLPHMYWQYKHEFISFKFHLFGRAEKHFDYKNILDYIGGQFALMGLLNFCILIFVLIKNKFTASFEKVLIWNSFGFLAFLFLLSFRNQIEANWSVSVGLAMIILFAPYITKKQLKIYQICFILPLSLLIIMRASLLSLDYFSVNYSLAENRINEIIGWREKRIPKIKSLCKDEKIVADAYQIAAKLSFYLNENIPALHINSRESQYSLWKFQERIEPDELICYLTSNKNKAGAIRVESNYKDPVYVVRSTTLNKQALEHGMTYEKIIRR